MMWFAHLSKSFQQPRDKQRQIYPWQTACQHNCSICTTNQVVNLENKTAKATQPN